MANAQSKMAAARAFVRSLNILLKFVRMYGFEHTRSATQFDTAWNELREAVPAGNDPGMLLGASEAQLLLDGAPVEASPVERSFARLLSSAGLASIQFLPSITREELASFVRAFPSGKANDSSLADQLKIALAGAQGIRVNEVRFVAEDPANPNVSLAAQLAAKSLGSEAGKLENWFKDPRKLLELIAAAEGSRGLGGPGASTSGAGAGGPGGTGSGRSSGAGSGGSGAEVGGADGGPYVPGGQAAAERGNSPAAGGSQPTDKVSGGDDNVSSSGYSTASAAHELVSGNAWPEPPPTGLSSPASQGPPQRQSSQGQGSTWVVDKNEQIFVLLRLLSRLGQVAGGQGGLQPGPFQQELSKLSTNSREILEKTLASLAAQTPAMRSDDPMLVHLAEHLAIRFALDRYERGELRVNAVRQMLDGMSEEIALLRKTLGGHEATLAQAGIAVESHADILDRRFWSSVPEAGKRAVLTSSEAWCIPPRNIRQYVEKLRHKGDLPSAAAVLENYAACIGNNDAQARRRVAIGLADLADLYTFGDAATLLPAIRHVGAHLAAEREAELQALMSAAFVRLTQEAGKHASYPALLQALDSLDAIEHQRPSFAQDVMPRLGFDKHIPAFLAEAIAGTPSDARTQLLQRLPALSTECLMARFNRVGYRAEKDRIVKIAREVGAGATSALRERLHTAPPVEAVEAAPLLAHVDAESAEKILLERLSGWPRVVQDRGLRLIAGSGAPQRGWILLSVFDLFDSLLRPLAVDEIGMSGEPAATEILLHLATGDLGEGKGTLLQLKAIEALGRIGDARAAGPLEEIAESKKRWRWLNHAELRLAAYHSLRVMKPAWAEDFLSRGGFSPEDLELAHLRISPEMNVFRHRRYPRLRLDIPVTATASSERETITFKVRTLSLGGGSAHGERRLMPGTLVSLRLGTGLRPIRAQALMRDARNVDLGFEFVDMQLDERARLRQFIHEHCSAVPAAKAAQKLIDVAVADR